MQTHLSGHDFPPYPVHWTNPGLSVSYAWKKYTDNAIIHHNLAPSSMNYQYNPLEFPQNPGVYLMKDERNRFIYVGKAKNLRSRVGSYFHSRDQSSKTRVMLTKVHNVEYITTLSEKEALLLESSLIKKHRPRYNIVLRDDKQYVLFRLDKSQPYPALELTRQAGKDGSIYFGPFTSAHAARQTLKVVNKLFFLRKCGQKKFRNRVRPCLQYYIQRCPGPCCLEVPVEDYHQEVRRLEMFLSGKSRELIRGLEQEMQKASRELNFERAALLRDQIQAVQKTTQSQSVVMPGSGDMDVFSPVRLREGLAIGVLFVRQGKVLDSKNFFWPEHYPESREEMSRTLASLLSQFYGPDKFIPEKIVLPEKMDDPALAQLLGEYRGGRVKLTKARGQSLQSLVRMARENCLQHAESRGEAHLPALASSLELSQEPRRIECIDVSHQSGQNTRMGVVVFDNGEPCKQDYRIYNLPNVSPGDDYQAMRDFILRRSRSSLPWPDLLLIDGGRGQLHSVQRALQEVNMQDLFALAAIAKSSTRSKGKGRDQVFISGRKNPLPFKANSRELLYLQRIRDEAHRFVSGSLRKSWRKKTIQSDLEKIPGLGPKRVQELWKHFGDLQKILGASQEELMQVPGFGRERAKKTAQALKEWNTTSS